MTPPRPRALDWQALAHAGLHKTKIEILTVIADGGNDPMSPAQVAVITGVSVPATSNHMQKLVADGLLVLDGLEPSTRGSQRHMYRATATALLSGGQAAHARLLAGANAKEFDPGKAMFEACERNGLISGYQWDLLDEPRRMRFRKAGREVFGVA